MFDKISNMRKRVTSYSNGTIVVLLMAIFEIILATIFLPLLFFLYLLKKMLNHMKTILYRTKSMQIKDLKQKIKNCKDYKEYIVLSSELDKLEGRDKWKTEDESDLYDYKLIQQRIKE